MAIEKGSGFLLKIGNGQNPISYQTVAGLRTTQMTINGEAIAVTTKDSGGWRELLSGGGIRTVSVTATGIFTGSAAETRLKSRALDGALDDYRLSFEGGEQLQGKFLLTKLEYAGDYNGERSYSISLESSGAVVGL